MRDPLKGVGCAHRLGDNESVMDIRKHYKTNVQKVCYLMIRELLLFANWKGMIIR